MDFQMETVPQLSRPDMMGLAAITKDLNFVVESNELREDTGKVSYCVKRYNSYTFLDGEDISRVYFMFTDVSAYIYHENTGKRRVCRMPYQGDYKISYVKKCPVTGSYLVAMQQGSSSHPALCTIIPAWKDTNTELKGVRMRESPDCECQRSALGSQQRVSFLRDGTVGVLVDHMCLLQGNCSMLERSDLQGRFISRTKMPYLTHDSWITTDHVFCAKWDRKLTVYDHLHNPIGQFQLKDTIRRVFLCGEMYLIMHDYHSDFTLIRPTDRGTAGFTMSVLHADAYLQLKQGGDEKEEKTKRFFTITKRLPMELQMVVCNKLRDPKHKERMFIPKAELDSCFLSALGR